MEEMVPRELWQPMEKIQVSNPSSKHSWEKNGGKRNYREMKEENPYNRPDQKSIDKMEQKQEEYYRKIRKNELVKN